MKHKKTWKWMLCIYFLMITMVCCFMYSYTKADHEEIFLTPTLQDNRGWDIYQLKGDKKIAISPVNL